MLLNTKKCLLHYFLEFSQFFGIKINQLNSYRNTYIVTLTNRSAYMPLPSAALSTFTNVPSGPVAGGAWSLISTRTNIRDNFPRAREGKRIKVHGWWKRMSTASGRRVLMRRILKGRHVLSH